MNLRIEKLSERNQFDFFRLFDIRQFVHQQEWKTCFCRYYHTDCAFEEWLNRTAEDNRLDAMRAIRDRRMSGLLAYVDHQCVGWLNVGCVLNYTRLFDQLESSLLDNKTALTICFVIHEDYRQKGIASALLDHAIELCRQEKYKRMIALPEDMEVRERNYRGFKQMYIKRGYKEHKSANRSPYLMLKL